MNVLRPPQELQAEIVALRTAFGKLMTQTESDLKSAHAEICKLQNLPPHAFTWPEWTPQANTIRWIAELRKKFGL